MMPKAMLTGCDVGTDRHENAALALKHTRKHGTDERHWSAHVDFVDTPPDIEIVRFLVNGTYARDSSIAAQHIDRSEFGFDLGDEFSRSSRSGNIGDHGDGMPAFCLDLFNESVQISFAAGIACYGCPSGGECFSDCPADTNG